MSELGHNQYKLPDTAKEALASFARRMDNLDEEKKEIAQQQKELKAQMKAQGFDTKAMNSALRRYRMDKEEREEQEQLSDLYLIAMEEQV